MRDMIMKIFEIIFRMVCNQYESFTERFKPNSNLEILKKDFRKYVTKSLTVGSIESTEDLKLVTCGTLLGPMQILIVYNPFIVMQSGACIAVNGGRYETDSLRPLTIIFVDGLFYRLSKDSQIFILFHELGHSVRGRKRFRRLKEEVACDKFAKANLKNTSAASALTEVRKLVASARGNRILKRISIAEIDKRISAAE